VVERRSDLENEEALAKALRKLARAEQSEVRVPTASQVWWKGEIRRRRADAKRAFLPLRLAYWVLPAILVVALFALFALQIPEFARWLGATFAGSTPENGDAGLATTMILVVMGTLGLLCAALIARAFASGNR
jgi:hypothetical protein